MNVLPKHKLVQAIELSELGDWVSPVDVAHLNRPRVRPTGLPGQGRVAAVLLLVYPNCKSSRLSESKEAATTCQDSDFDLNLVLTKRNSGLSNHGGQISFPGGRQDDGESLWQTACRETFEEIGVGQTVDSEQADSEDVIGDPIELIGRLNPVYIPPSDFTVSPFVGWQDSRPEFARAIEEVEQVIEVSLADLLDPKSLKQGEVVTANSGRLEVPYYQAGEHRVWGATAIMLSELLERIRRFQD